MILNCREVQQSLKAFQAGTLPADISAAVDGHLDRCAQCRSAARRQGLERLLQAAAQAPSPLPSEFFMTRLRGALADCPTPRPPATMAELLVRSGLRLTPAMAALVMLISIGSAYLAAPPDNASAAVPAEELLLDDHPLSADLVLAAIAGEAIER